MPKILKLYLHFLILCKSDDLCLKSYYCLTKLELHFKGYNMEFKINISLKSGVLDPEGKAIENALIRKGYTEVKNVKVGRLITLNIEGSDKSSSYERVSQMCCLLYTSPSPRD